MCGIWAVFGSDETTIQQCLASHRISHRGPDCFRIQNVNHLKNCRLGFHRLAIVDDIWGMQPLNLTCHPYLHLIYNGEIFNHKQLISEFEITPCTKLDGEPFIHLYSTHGPKVMAAQMDGVFAFCILDMHNRRVVIGRDTFGVRPMFRIATEDGFLAVCSEAKGLMGLPHGELDLDKYIEPFPPGHIEIYDLDLQGRAHFKERICFHSAGEPPAYKTLVSPTDGDVKENVASLLEAAVDKRLMSDRRIGCLLSGGLDSSLVAALLVKLAKQKKLGYPVQTFSIGMEGSPDLLAARKVAKHLGTEHHEVIMTQQQGLDCLENLIRQLETYDITTVRASVGMYLLSKYIRQNTDTTVILSGEGADEVAQGYIYFHKAPSPEDADTESRRLLADLHMYDVLRGDRTTAVWGLEIRVPFLDHQWSSYYLSLDKKLRQPQDGVEKHLLRSAFDGKSLLPNDILWRAKEAFSDGISSVKKSWFEILQDHCDNQICDKELKEASILFPHNTPKTKEALYYRRLFEKYYPGRAEWIPYFWMPKWIASGDPSARTLKHYKQ